MYFGKIARLPDNAPARQITFQSASLKLHNFDMMRRRGRPRANWVSEIYKHAEVIAGNEDRLYQIIFDKEIWKQHIREYCRLHL